MSQAGPQILIPRRIEADRGYETGSRTPFPAFPEAPFGTREQLLRIRQQDGEALRQVRDRLAFVSTEQPQKGSSPEKRERLSSMQRRNMEHVQMMIERQIQFSKDYPDTHPLHMLFNATTAKETLELIGATAVEMFSDTVTWWGPGDLVSLGEAALGRTIFGEKLSGWERLGEVAAAAIPFVPAYPVIKIYRLLRLPAEAAALPRTLQQYAKDGVTTARDVFLAWGGTINEAKHPNDPKYQEALEIAANRLFPPKEVMV